MQVSNVVAKLGCLPFLGNPGPCDFEIESCSSESGKDFRSENKTALELHSEAVSVATNYKKCESELLAVIAKIEKRRAYLEFEVTSLYSYCVELLGLSGHTANNFIDVVRTSKKVPSLAEAIHSGKTTVSKARKICSVITPENCSEWIELVIHCSARVGERAVAAANPRAAVPESLKYVSSDVLELRLAVSEMWSRLLSDTKDVLSQRECRAVSTEEALFILMSEFKRRNDPLTKALRAVERNGSKAKSTARNDSTASAVSCDSGEDSADILVTVERNACTESANTSLPKPARRSRYVSADTRHRVNARDKGQCTFVDRHGTRCGSRRWLQRHHREDFAKGGDHSVENLQTLCWGHHCMLHR